MVATNAVVAILITWPLSNTMQTIPFSASVTPHSTECLQFHGSSFTDTISSSPFKVGVWSQALNASHSLPSGLSLQSSISQKTGKLQWPLIAFSLSPRVHCWPPLICSPCCSQRNSFTKRQIISLSKLQIPQGLPQALGLSPKAHKVLQGLLPTQTSHHSLSCSATCDPLICHVSSYQALCT